MILFFFCFKFLQMETFVQNVVAPKELGDVFESVAGAIFVDCGMNLDVVWSVYEPYFSPVIGECRRF